MHGQLRTNDGRPDAPQPQTPRSRSSSTNSNTVTSPASTSTVSSARLSGFTAIPFTPTPQPAYIAASSASESVKNALQERQAAEDIGTVIFSDSALAQINTFLDTLLYNVLSHAHSSTLARIKPAVDSIVKGSLGQRAIARAEQELEDLLGDGEDDDELEVEEREQSCEGTWDLSLNFRRTRLRLMVYMSLATMDDDEEEHHVQEDHLDGSGEDDDDLAPRVGLVSWKALMFLTAVLEYLAETSLEVVGKAAVSRTTSSRQSNDLNSSASVSVATSASDRLTITDADVRKMNLSPAFSRLWRSWKKVSSSSVTSKHLSQQGWNSALAMRRSSAFGSSNDEGPLKRRTLELVSANEDSLSSRDSPRRPYSDQSSSRRPSPLDAPKRSRSFNRFPVAVAPSGTGSWRASVHSRRPVEAGPAPRNRHVRSNSLPPGPKLSVVTGVPRPRSDGAPVSAVEIISKRNTVAYTGSPIDLSKPYPNGSPESLRTRDVLGLGLGEGKTPTINEVVPMSSANGIVPRVVTPVETVPEETIPEEASGADVVEATEPAERVGSAEPTETAVEESPAEKAVVEDSAEKDTEATELVNDEDDKGNETSESTEIGQDELASAHEEIDDPLDSEDHPDSKGDETEPDVASAKEQSTEAQTVPPETEPEPEPPSASSTASQAKPPPADDDEYDPFRAIAPIPSPRSYVPPPPAFKKSATPSPTVSSPTKSVFEAGAKEASKQGAAPGSNHVMSSTAGEAALAGATAAAVAAATAGVISSSHGQAQTQTQAQTRKKPAPIVISSNGETHNTTQMNGTSKLKAQENTTSKSLKDIVSPLRMSPVNAGDYDGNRESAAPSLPLTEDTQTSDDFVTPPRSPVTVKPASPNGAPVMPAPAMPAPEQKAAVPVVVEATAEPQNVANQQAAPGTPAKKFSTTNNLAKSTEGTFTTGSRPMSGAPVEGWAGQQDVLEENKPQFNDLMNGNGTVKKTLTPKNLTEIEKPNSSQRRQEVVKSIIASEGSPAVSPTNTTYPVPTPSSRTSSIVSTQPTGKPATIVSNIQRSASTGGYIPRSPRNSLPGGQLSAKSSRSGLQARDSRVQREDTRELAAFLRSTAPDRPPPTPKPFIGASQSIEGLRTTGQSQPGQLNTDMPQPVRPVGAANRLSQLRGLRSERTGNEELIAFLNDGPPGAHVNKTRSMETTGSSIKRGESPINRSGSALSFNESMDSHSNLIQGGRRGGSNPALSSDSPRSPAMPVGRSSGGAVPKQMGGGAPMRKQRRVKDPYAIDLDDEDEEEDDILMGLPNKKEEQGMSMIDFLKSTEPPARTPEPTQHKNANQQPTTQYKKAQQQDAARANAASPMIPDFLRDSSRGPSARSSRDSVGEAYRAQGGATSSASRRSGSMRSSESKSRFSFLRRLG